MFILAFESSCDETSVSVISHNDGRFEIKSDIIASQTDVHRLYGGVVPEIASRAHIEAISRITYEALEVAKVKISDIDLVAVTANPGLIGALLVGVNFAKSFAYANSIPMVAVDHIKGHVGAAYLTEKGSPKTPFVALVVSGGHTAIYFVKTEYDFELIGTTRDDAAGESFDKVGRILGIPYPAGAGFDKLAREGFEKLTGKKENFYTEFGKIRSKKIPELRLPSPAIADAGFDLSFSGLKTAAINLLHRYEMKNEELPRAEFAASYTYEAITAIADKLDGAIKKYDVKTVVMAGGVAANSHLRYFVRKTADKNKTDLFVPPLSLCGDNAAMIGVAGFFAYQRGDIADISLNASAMDKII